MGDNDRGYFHPNKIDKGIKSVDVSAGTKPPGLLSMTPMRRAPSTPNGRVQGPNISSALDLSKLTPSIAAGVRQVVARK